jgi:L-ascorbate metabolism protein UlaG (beta-lactamase superfamily)
LHPEFSAIAARCGPFDAAILPIGAYDPRWFMHVVHVNPDEAVQACVDLCTSHPEHPTPLVLGIHWGTFRLTDEPMDEPPRRAVAQWRERGLDPERLWIARFGETRQL